MYVLLIIIGDRPGLTQLQHLQTRDREPIRLLQDIVPRYGAFGTCLLADENGIKMTAIESDYRSAEEKTNAIFTKFLEGELCCCTIPNVLIVASVGKVYKSKLFPCNSGFTAPSFEHCTDSSLAVALPSDLLNFEHYMTV